MSDTQTLGICLSIMFHAGIVIFATAHIASALRDRGKSK